MLCKTARPKFYNPAIGALSAIGLALFAASCGGPGSKAAPDQAATSQAVPPNPRLSGNDSRFLVDMTRDNLGQIMLAKLAVERAHAPDVKATAQHVVEDHTKMNADLANLAALKGIGLPDTGTVASNFSANDMKTAHGDRFDRAYLRHLISAHRETIQAFQKEATEGVDNDVKQFAANNIQILNGHLFAARKVLDGKREGPG